MICEMEVSNHILLVRIYSYTSFGILGSLVLLFSVDITDLLYTLEKPTSISKFQNPGVTPHN